MKNSTLKFSLWGIILVMSIVFSSCEKEKSKYQVRIQNEMYTELLGIPFMKYNVTECKLGGNVFSDVAYGEYSEYVNIESSTDYELSVTVEMLGYDPNTFLWSSMGSETYDLGTVSWVDDEDYDKHKVKLQIGDLINAYAPVYSKFAEE